MSESEVLQGCKEIYTETNDFYNRYRETLGDNDLGFKILYGPPMLAPPILFIGDQPGGQVADEKPRERFEWPRQCEYATESWHLARNMQGMFGASFLLDCVGINANFFRAPSSKAWKQVPSGARLALEDFCAVQLRRIIALLNPTKIVVIGFATLDKFGTSEPVLYGSKRRVLIRGGSIYDRPTISTLHLSGAQISKEDRITISRFIKSPDKIVGVNENKTLKTEQPPSEMQRGTPMSLPLANTLDFTDPNLAIETVTKLQNFGLIDEIFGEVHQSYHREPKNRETIRGFIRWCEKNRPFTINKGNFLLNMALYDMLNECERTPIERVTKQYMTRLAISNREKYMLSVR